MLTMCYISMLMFMRRDVNTLCNCICLNDMLTLLSWMISSVCLSANLLVNYDIKKLVLCGNLKSRNIASIWEWIWSINHYDE